MPDTHVDNLKVGVSGTPGTGTATIGSAASGCRGFVAGDDGKTFSGRWTDGTAWETATGCLYTHSGTTLTRGTLKESSTGSAISLTSAAVFECAPLAELGNRVEQIALQDVTITDAAVTMQVGKRYRGSIAAFTADRTYTLPAVFAAGDMIEVCITEGDDTYELLVTAASGDTLNGVAGGTEWSRVFITGEVVRFRGDVANSAWVVDYDGRIPSYCMCSANITISSTFTATTQSQSTATNPHGMVSSNDVVVRRAGRYLVGQDVRNNPSAAGSTVRIDTTGFQFGGATENISNGNQAFGQSILVDLAVGASRAFRVQSSATGTVNCHSYTVEQL